jgi:hypothetical protein
VQHKLDKQFARDTEESILRRGPRSSPTPAPRPKRATKAPARFNGTVGKKNKGKEGETDVTIILYNSFAFVL